MNEIIKQNFQDEIVKLPKIKVGAINSINWGVIIEEIGKKFGLIDEEIENLQIETGLVLVGLTSVEDFSFNIENSVGLNKDIIENIQNDIIEKIFKPISSIVIKDIKNGLELKKISWDMSINFIVSGGDYAVFLN